MRVLGIESSCDETAAAVVDDGRTILSSAVASQVKIHASFGGVVPELASREHIRAVIPVVHEALNNAGTTLEQVDGIAVTQGPGLVGSLLIGLGVAKSISAVRNIPLTGVSHLEAHIMAAFLGPSVPEFPLIALVVSGGHTNLYLVRGFLDMELLGQTRDDAAGEAFDKVAKFMGLGYPGGVVIDKIAPLGNPDAIRFARPMLGTDSLDFSFSGLKTAVVNYLRKNPLSGDKDSREVYDLAASFQEAAVDVLVDKLIRAADQRAVANLVISGGVAANSRLRSKAAEAAREKGMRVFTPSVEFCTDNAVMVAALGYHRFKAGLVETTAMDAYSRVACPAPASAANE